MSSWFKWLIGGGKSEQSMRDKLAFYTSSYYTSQDYSKSEWDECHERIENAKKRGYGVVECSPWLTDGELAKLSTAGHKWAYAGRLNDKGDPDTPQESWVDVWVKK